MQNIIAINQLSYGCAWILIPDSDSDPREGMSDTFNLIDVDYPTWEYKS